MEFKGEIKACIFDLDGTLTDTLESLEYSVNATMEEIGMPPISRQQCRAFVGNGARYLIRCSLAVGGDEAGEKLEQAMEVYGRIFDANCTYKVVPYDGILELIDGMRKKGILMAVLSNKPHRQAVHVVEEIFGKGTFSRILGQQEGVPRKPDPTAALSLAADFGVLPEETLYVGDSEVDIRTGNAAKMQTVLVSWGFRDREQLEKDGAECIADRPQDILEML